MDTNWAIFNDKGCVESGCTEPEARERTARYMADGDEHAYAAQECRDHEGYPASNCEECDNENEED